jgi:anti-sigma regulatory factor (Ser/Thr protein kinase)
MPVSDCLVLNAMGHPGCDAADWIVAWAEQHGLDDDTQFAMRLCIEELITNWANHGLTRSPVDHQVSLTARLGESSAGENAAGEPEVVVDIIDDGRHFDVATALEPGKEGNIHDATVGGRGIRLMRAFARSLAWQPHKDGNHTTFTFAVTAAATPDR